MITRCLVALVLAGVVASGGFCRTATASSRLIQYLDETTAVTVTAMSEPFVFYKEEPGLAANLRDYVHLGPVEINRSGQRTYYLWAGIWSTLDRGGEPAGENLERMIVTANDRPMEFELFSENSDMLGTVEEIYPEPANGTKDAFYPVTIEQLRTIYEADFLYISFGELGPAHGLYRAWKSPGQSLKHFIDYALGEAEAS